MTPKALDRPFIGISICQDDYIKVEGLLPTPTFKYQVHSMDSTKLILVFVIDGYISSFKRYQWLSDIKLSLKDYIFIPFQIVDEVYISSDTDMKLIIYTLQELTKAFRTTKNIYPKILYPPNKKELYRYLCRYATRLVHQQLFTKEAIIGVALEMNSKLTDKYSYKELIKKALGVFVFIDKVKAKLPKRLNPQQLKQSRQKGAIISNAKQREQTLHKIDTLLSTNNYLKKNNKINKTKLAKDLGISRKALYLYQEVIQKYEAI